MELLYFTDISQVRYVVDCIPELFNKKRAMTGDIVVAYELERLGIDFIDEWDFLGAEDIEANFETARLLSTTWWDESMASTEYEGFALSDTAQQDLIYPFEASLNARTVYSKLFSEYQISNISGFFLPSVGVFRTGPIPTNRAVRSVAQAVLFYMAEKRGIPVEKLESSRPLSAGTLAIKTTGLSKTKASQVAEEKEGEEKIVLVYEDGMYPDEFSVLMETLGKLPKIKAISISQRVLDLGMHAANTKSGIGCRLQEFQIKLLERTKFYKGMYPEIFGNKHLQFQFDCIGHEIAKATGYGDVYAAFVDVINPALVVFGHEAFTRERTLIRLAKKRNICSAALMHGVARHRFTYRGIVGDADQIMVANDTDFEGLVSHGIDKSRLNKVGCLRYEERYLQNNHPDLVLEMANAKSKAKEMLGLDPIKPVVVWTTAAINAGFASPLAEPRKHREAIREFLVLVWSKPELQFVIKAHPSYDYYEIYRLLLEQKLPNISFPEQATLSEIVSASDICLMINYCTTAALEAMFNRVPAVYLNTAVYSSEDRQDNLSKIGIHRVDSVFELGLYIDEILTNPKIKARALELADEGLKAFLEIDGDHANSKLYDFLAQALNHPKKIDSDELRGAQRMHELHLFLENKQALPSDYFSELAKRHSGKQLMYAIAYFAGISNLEFAKLASVFEMIKTYQMDRSLGMWRIARWEYLPLFITGKLNVAKNNVGRLNTFLLFRHYFLRPSQFFLSPPIFRRNAKVHIAKAFLGRAGISIINWVMKNSYYLRVHKH